MWPDENGHELAEKTVPPMTPGKSRCGAAACSHGSCRPHRLMAGEIVAMVFLIMYYILRAGILW